MKKLLSKFKVLVPALVCLLALTMVLFTGCKEDVPAHTHSMTHVEGTAATCTTTGVKEHYHCSTCEKDFLTKEGTEEVSAESLVIAIDENNHNYNLSETEFAFAKNEQGEWTCVATTKCSRNAEHNKLVAHATKVEEEKVTEATCENGGSYTLKATFENTLYGTNGVVTKENITTTALGHNYGSLVAEVPATCTKEGTKAHYHCSVCDKKFVKEGENYVVKTDAELVIAKTSHTMTHHAEVPATCTENGTREYYSCSECGFNYSDINGTTKLEDLTITAVGHHTYAYGSEPTYNIEEVVEDGQKKYKCTGSIQCSRCNHIETETVYAIATQGTTKPTCTTNGSIKLTFRFTKTDAHFPIEKQTTYTLNKLGHSMSHTAARAATCEEAGNIEYYHCSTCDKNFTDEAGTAEVEGEVTITALKHNYTNEDGQTNYVYDYENARYVAACTRCNHQDTTQTKSAGTEQYPYLAKDDASLVSAVANGGYIKLAQDISVAGKIDIKKNVVIDLNGKKVSYLQTAADNHNDKTATRKNYCVFGVSAGEATIKNGTIEYTVQEGLSEVGQGRAVMAENTTKLTLTNVTITSDFRGIDLFDNSKTTITNCTITTKCESVGGNNLWGPSQEGNLTVTIDNSTITSENETALFVPSYMVVNITNNSSLTGNTSAIYAMMGKINVDGTSTLHASATNFDVRTVENIGETGPNEAPKDGAALVIRANYYYDKTAKTNKLTLNIADWSKVTATSGVKAAVYNWTFDSKYISEAKTAGLTVTDQFLEVVAKLADKKGVKFYEYNGTEVKEMSVYTHTYVQEANEETKTERITYLTKIVATTKEVDMGETSGMPQGYLFYTAGYENGELQETSTGMYMAMDKDSKLIYVCVNDEEGTMPLTFKVNQGNILSLALYANGSETEAYFLFDDGKFGIVTPSTEGNTFAEYDCTVGQDGVVLVVIDQNTTRKFEIDASSNSLNEIKGLCYGEKDGQKTYYDTLQEAVKNAQSGETITLISDVELSSFVVYRNVENTNNTLTLDLNGHTISSDDKLDAMFAVIGGELTIKNGQIVTGNAVLNCITVIGYTESIGEGNTKVYTELHSKLTLEETLSVSSKGSCVYVYGEGAELVTAATLYSEGNYSTLTGSGNKEDMIKSVSVIGGRIAHKDSTAIYIPNCKNWNISGGTITGATAVYIKSGTVNITGGDFYATGEYKKFEHRNDGCESTGAALVIEACGYPGGDPVVTISGGNFSFKCGTDNGTQGIEVYNYDGHTATIKTNKEYRTVTVAK